MRCKNCGFVFFEERERCPKCGNLLKTPRKEKPESEATIPLFHENTDITTDARVHLIDEVEEKEKTAFTRTRKIYRRRLESPPLQLRIIGCLIDELLIALFFFFTVGMPYYFTSGTWIPASFQVKIWWLVLWIAEHLFYYPFSHFMGATSIGKLIVGIKILPESGSEDLPFYLVFAKTLLAIVFTLTCGINWIYILFNTEHLPLQDVFLGLRYVETD